jgi:SAM-dependent methyltransferase
MPSFDNSEYWDLFWDERLEALQNLGKREAILAISSLMRRLERETGRPLHLLEPGCGEGQIIGNLVEGHAALVKPAACVGVDYLAGSVRTARRTYPSMTFIEGDIRDPALFERPGPLRSSAPFDVVLMVNALHEVFSAGYSEELGEIDVPAAKQAVREAFQNTVRWTAPGGFVVLFDGLETSGDLGELVRVRFLHPQARTDFETFAREYRPFRITYRETDSRTEVVLSRRDFTRYIDKSIFLGKRLWETERLESYQYFNAAEFQDLFAGAGLEIVEQRTLTVDEDKWRTTVEILTPGVDFPEEHILIIAKKHVTVL